MVAAHGLGSAERPALVVACGAVAPDGGIGLGFVAHPPHGDQVAVGVALPGRHDLVDALVLRFHVRPLPAATVVGRPRGSHGGTRLRVVDRSQDEPRLALGGGRHQIGHVGHRLLVGDGGARRPLEGGVGGVGGCAGATGAGPGDQGQATCREGRPTAGARAGRTAAHLGPRHAAGLGVHGEPPVVDRVPVEFPQSPSRCSILVAGDCPVQSNRHVRGSEAPR